MAYRSLYRKWRPLKFDELVGQEHITKTLKNAIARDNISHAYLFCGPRGTGKTTVAKILARAANCTAIKDSEPCGKCDSCINIIAGSSMDVFELDAASNRGIDEMRDLKEKTRYMASEGRFKVYIIDEAHMLTNEAFNALLKTLEEPPPGVIFIMATTDPSKLPPTVVSRCQRLDFRLLTASEVEERIRHVATNEGWQFEEKALPLIARLSEGALRDALGFLEQVYAFGGGIVSADNVYDLAGMTREETLLRIVEAIYNGDVREGLEAIQEVAFGGKDMQLFLKEQIQFFKQLLIYTAGGEMDKDYENYHLHLQKYKSSFSRESLLSFISLLDDAAGKLRLAEHAHFILEITFLNMLNEKEHQSLKTDEDLVKKFIKLEDKLKFIEDNLNNQMPSYRSEEGKKTELDEKKEQTIINNETETNDLNVEGRPEEKIVMDSDDFSGHDVMVNGESGIANKEESLSLNSIWQDVLKIIQKNKQISTQALLQMLQPESIENDILFLSYEKGNKFLKEKIEEPGRNSLILKVVAEVTGKALKISLIEREDNKRTNDTGTLKEKAPEENQNISANNDEQARGENDSDSRKPASGKETEGDAGDMVASGSVPLENNKITGDEKEFSGPEMGDISPEKGEDLRGESNKKTEFKGKIDEKSGVILNSDFIISEAKSLFNGKMIENEN